MTTYPKYQLMLDPVSYKVTAIYRPEDQAWIPLDEANIDYQAYLKWVEEGNTAEPFVPPDQV